MSREDWRLETRAVRQAMAPTSYGENSEALFLTSGYVQPDAQTAARRFAGEDDGFTYGRYGNPTTSSFEQRLAAMEGTEAAMGTASGMAAVLMMCMGLLQAGDHVVASRSMFGSTIKLLGTDLAKFGVETTFVAQADVSEWRAEMRPNTKLLFAETPTNPLTEVCDIQALADLAHNAGALMAVDNCFATPVLQRPTAFGADIVVHSGTKFLDGQGRVMAGALCASQALVDKAFLPVLKSAGMTLAPFNAWVVLKGLETLAIRMRAQSENALNLAGWLAEQAPVSAVHYPALASHPQHALAMRQMGDSGGAVLSFDVGGDSPELARERAFRVLDQLETLSLCTNLGDTKTLCAHPASTSHGRLSEAQRQASGVTQGLIRVSVGLEHQADIQADLLNALNTL